MFAVVQIESVFQTGNLEIVCGLTLNIKLFNSIVSSLYVNKGCLKGQRSITKTIVV